MRQATSLMLGTASTLAQVAGFAEESVQDMENIEYGELFLTEPALRNTPKINMPNRSGPYSAHVQTT